MHSTTCIIPVTSILTAAKNNIPYTQPYSKHCPARSGWNDYVKSFQRDTGFVHDMKCATRKSYHKQENYVIKRDPKLKGEKLAARYLYHKLPAIWDDLAKMRGSRKTPSSSFNGIFDSKSIANLFTEYYSDIYNYVSFDEEEMPLLYDNVCKRVECTVNEDCINIDLSAVKHSISKLKAGKHNGFDGLSSDFILNGT